MPNLNQSVLSTPAFFDETFPVSTRPAHKATSRKYMSKLLLGIVATVVIIIAIGVALYATQSSVLQKNTLLQRSNYTGLSICYDSYESWLPGKTLQHFAQIKERFAGVRTFQTLGLQNHIDVAAQVGLQIYSGVWIQHQSEEDIVAAVDGARRSPSTVKAIFVGNEELLGGRFTQHYVIAKVKKLKQLLLEAGIGHIPVGAVQTDGDWFGASILADHCDVIGVNIHPFFSGSEESRYDPIQDLNRRWSAIYERYGSKAVLTETGWPTSGNARDGHVPSMELAEKYYHDVEKWTRDGHGGDMPSYFMFHDNEKKVDDIERAFGIAWASGEWKFLPNSSDQPLSEVKGNVFVNVDSDDVLAVTPDHQVEFHHRWREWREDEAAIWTIRGMLFAIWEPMSGMDICLDAYEPLEYGGIHLNPCDSANPNQHWQYDSTTKQFRHVTHDGYCLDKNHHQESHPSLSYCTDDSSQQFELWRV